MRLFVYGTLKRGFRNACYLNDAEYLGEFSTCSDYSMYDFGGYPAVSQEGDSAIAGEVYAVNPEHLAATDRLEWYPDFYQRVVIETAYGEAWMYVVQPALCIGKTRVQGHWL